MNERFLFTEDFSRYGEDYIPYGIEIEAATHLWHKHIRPTEGGMAIAAPGNKYFLKAPESDNYTVSYEVSFAYVTDYAALTLYTGYSRIGHNGYEIVIGWNKTDATLSATLRTLADDRTAGELTKIINTDFFPSDGRLATVTLGVGEGSIDITVNESDKLSFECEARTGAVGFGRPNFIGEIIYRKARFFCAEAPEELSPPVKVELPLEEGGTMPLTVEFRLTSLKERKYLTVTLDGGPQYRAEKYPYYDPEGRRSQYVVEQWYMKKPYVLFGGKKYYLSLGNINTSDGLHWKGILDVYLGMVDFPVSVTFPVDGDGGYSSGYEHLFVKGFGAQEGRAEYNYSQSGEYLGKTVFPDTFELRSPEDKYAVSMIEDTVYEAEIVRDHFRRGHFFADGEAIEFKIYANTTKKYLTYEATLTDVFGDELEPLTIGKDLKISHAPLPIGVYRVILRVMWGDSLLKEINTTFEVFDKTGEKCAPLESGLPVLYSTPNEQKYLDRDKFDPWNPGRANNTEHYYSVSAFLGYVGERKRVWEVIKKFGRRWYAWLTNRIYGTHADAEPQNHPAVAANADYVGYQHDYTAGSYMFRYGKRTMPLLEDFLDSIPGARDIVGHKRGEEYNHKKHFLFMKNFSREWSDLLVSESVKARREGKKMLEGYNPNIKLAYYGPFPVYAAHLRSYSMLEYYAYPTDKDLHDLYYSGFCQLEDYPASCSYQTYRGPFTVGSMLAKMPNLVFYPEQYKSALGGCIDGHVKFANPPLGKYKMPIWFNVTLARDYVYNTAVRSAEGYRFWDTYGFMHSDHPEEQDDYFIRNWKYILRHKPASVARSPIFFAEFPKEESRFEEEFNTVIDWRVYMNPSEEGIAHVYETSRLAGLPMGSYATWDALDTLTERDTDLLVLPSTKNLTENRLSKIRELHSKGVALFAVSLVEGLEDLFGVEYAPHTEKLNALEKDGETEEIYPYTETLNYIPTTSVTELSASGQPILLTNGNTAILNLPAYSVGRIHFKEHPYLGRATNSELYRRVTSDILLRLTSPVALADPGLGITRIADVDGKDILLAIDYSRYDESEIDLEREYTVILKEDFADALSLDGKPIRRLASESGMLDAITVTLRQHESTLIELKKIT